MKRIGLAIAIATLGTTGIASAAGIGIHTFSSDGSSQAAGIEATTDQLALNCLVASGFGQSSSCSAGVTNPSVSLPGLDSVTGLTGLVDTSTVLSTVQGLPGRVQSTAGGLAAQAAAASPIHCIGAVGLPAEVAAALPAMATDAVSSVISQVNGLSGSSITT